MHARAHLAEGERLGHAYRGGREVSGMSDELVLPAKKKKAKKRDVCEAPDPVPLSGLGEGEDCSYSWLLRRAFDLHNSKGLVPAAKATFDLPKLVKEGSRRRVWVNFHSFCQQCHRQPDHVLAFVASETCATCSLTADNSLAIKAQVTGSQVANICRQYVNKFVICNTCKGVTTLFERDQSTRLTFVACQTCLSRRSAPAVQKPFVSRQRQTHGPDL